MFDRAVLLTVCHCACLPGPRRLWQVVSKYNGRGYYCRHLTRWGAQHCARRQLYKPHEGVRL